MIIPENWECIIENGVATFKEKKQTPPRSWEEFCERYPKQNGEAFINISSRIAVYDVPLPRNINTDKSLCTSKEEAEAFLALMQLRQLRKAWVGDWEQPDSNNLTAAIVYDNNKKQIIVNSGYFLRSNVLSLPTQIIAYDFLGCFRDLCETAKFLL